MMGNAMGIAGGIAGKMAALGLVGLTILGTGCTKKEDRMLFDGFYFKSRAAAVERKTSLADFTVTVRDVSQSLEGARAAGGYEGTRYCIRNFGNSRIDWAVGPDTDPGLLSLADNTLVFRGTCLRP